jgi:ATP-dependent RNA helicase DDX3X
MVGWRWSFERLSQTNSASLDCPRFFPSIRFFATCSSSSVVAPLNVLPCGAFISTCELFRVLQSARISIGRRRNLEIEKLSRRSCLSYVLVCVVRRRPKNMKFDNSDRLLCSLTTGSKYVPPHLRNSQSNGGNSAPRPVGGGGGRSSSSSGYDDRPRGGGGGGGGGGYDDRRGGGGGGRSYGDDRRGGGYDHGGGGGYDRGGDSGPPAPRATNSRWADAGGGGGGGGYDRGGGGGGYSRNAPRTNDRGFHGDTQPDPRMERTLFGTEDRQTTGINFDNYDKIPVEVSGEGCPDPIDVYSPETIGEDLHRNTLLCGYTRPTPVQKYSVPIGNVGRDLMACAQTGSGKTAGFLFPIIMSMLKHGGNPPPEGSRRQSYPEALVMAPTRELAQQIHEESKRFTYCTGIATVCIYGGAEVREQLRQIERGCDLLIATPGRLVDLIERGRLGMDNVRFLVLDEADRMLDMGFEVCHDWMRKTLQIESISSSTF